MDVILSLGFLCNIFKKAPTVRLFADDYFLDEFNFDYDFVSSTEKYQNGDFNEIILSIFGNQY